MQNNTVAESGIQHTDGGDDEEEEDDFGYTHSKRAPLFSAPPPP